MINKIICVLLLTLYIILIYLVIKELNNNKFNNIESFQLYKTNDKQIEHFEDEKVDKWGDSQEQIDAKTQGLNKKQEQQVDNRINVKVNQAVKDAMNNQPDSINSSVGQQSIEPGPQGPPGGEYLASGLLINKFQETQDSDMKMSVTRVYGEGDSGKTYMEITDSFSPSYQWQFYKDGEMKNRLDNKCLTTSGKPNSDLFMSECDNNSNQLWNWDNKSNRLVLKSSMNSTDNQKCIGLSGKKIDENTLLAGCSDNNKDCGNKVNKHKRYLQLKNCNSNVNPEEVWTFKY